MYKKLVRYEDAIRQVKLRMEIDEGFNNVQKVYIFGSYVKNDAGLHSDLDVYVVYNTDFYNNSQNKRFMRRYSCDLYDPDSMAVELDTHYCSEEQWVNNSLDLIPVIKKEGVLIWERTLT